MSAFINFIVYFCTSVVLLFAFVQIYVFITPHKNFALIKSGNIPAALVLAASMLGFVFPLATLLYVGISWLDFVFWSIVAGSVQLALFSVLYGFFPIHFEKFGTDKISPNTDCILIAQATVYVASSICVGILNAFSYIPF